ncbi:T9SS type A sorting domain-containing protein [candidate division KSB1 bacterium]
MKKVIIILIISSFFISDFAKGQWVFMGFDNESVHAIAVHPDDPDIIFASGNALYKSINGGIGWDTVAYYPFNSIRFHPLGTDTMYATFGIGTFSDGIYKSTDGGNTWNVLNWLYMASDINIPSYPPGMMLAASNYSGIQLSYDHGTTWQNMNDSLTNQRVLSLANFIWAGGGPIFLAGTNGGIYRHTTGFWDHMNSSINIHVPAISIFIETSPLCWAAFNGGSNSDGMYKSTDFGLTWTVSEYWDFITDILINPIDSQIVYAADSGMGVKMTMNGGVSWTPMNTNLTDSVVYCLAQSISDTFTLYAGTSSGLFKYALSTGIKDPIQGKNNFSIYPNPARHTIEITLKELGTNDITIQINDNKGQKIFSRQFSTKSKTISQKIDVSEFSSGIYFVSIIGKDQIKTRKLIIY